MMMDTSGVSVDNEDNAPLMGWMLKVLFLVVKPKVAFLAIIVSACFVAFFLLMSFAKTTCIKN